MENREKRQQLPVHRLISEYIAISGKSQIQIASEIGYPKANIITMFKSGSTPIPINKVGPLAKSLGLDAVHLLRSVMRENYAESWDCIEAIFKDRPLLTNSEDYILSVVREASKGDVLELNDSERDEITALIGKIAARNASLKSAAVKMTYDTSGKGSSYKTRDELINDIVEGEKKKKAA